MRDPRSAGWLVVIAVIAVVVWRAWPVIEALIVSTVLAGALWPWVSRLANVSIGPGWRMPRVAAVALIYLVTFLTLGALVWIAVAGMLPVLDRVVADHPGPTAELRRWMDAVRAPTVEEGAQRVVEEATRPTDPRGAALGAVGGAVTTSLVLLFTFMLLVSGDTIAAWLFMLLPRADRADARALAMRIRDRMSNWVLGWLSYGALNGAIVFGVTAAVGVPSPWTFGVVGIVFALIPGVGTSLVYLPAVFGLLDQGWRPMALVAAAGLHHLLDAAILAPRVLGGELRVPPIVMIVAMLIATALFGFWGALVATPATVAIQQVLRERLSERVAAAEPVRMSGAV